MSRRSGVLPRSTSFLLLICLFSAFDNGPHHALRAQAPQLKPEEMAAQMLNAANKAFNEKQYPFAIERYREYLKQFSNQKEATSARFGLAVSLMELPARDAKVAIELLNQVIGVADFSDRPLALYYLAIAHRHIGLDALAQAVAKPAEAAQHKNVAKDNFTPAAQRFAEATAVFVERAKTAPADPAGLPTAEAEWVARATCDRAELLLRLENPKEAGDQLTAWLANPATAKSKFRRFALYLHGQAAFVQKDYLGAGRSLSQLAPFDEPVFGLHAQYLLARTHHLSEERPEAAALYDAVQKGYEKAKVDTQKLLQNAAAFKDQPDEKLRLETFIKSPLDYVARSSFYFGVLLCEQQKYGDALPRFATFAQQHPQSPLLPEAQLRQGICQYETRQLAPAQQSLQPLTAHPTLGDRAFLWLGRSVAAAADPTQPQPYDAALKVAIGHFQQAADKANQLAATDPESKHRRAEALLELGDYQQLTKQFAPAAASYEIALKDKLAPERDEEFLQRRATALHFAAQYDPSDQACVEFVTRFPKSTLLPAVLFRTAENAFVRASAIEPTNPASKNPDLIKWIGEGLKRYQTLIDKYPEFTYVSLAKYRMALSHYRLGDHPKALAILATIPQSDQQGEAALTSYYHADCLLRAMPTDSSDALAAGRQLLSLTEAITLLERFIGMQATPQTALPQTPDALLKLGYCYQRMATQIAEPNERNAKLTAARQAFEKVTTQFDKSSSVSTAVLERATCMIDQNDIGSATNELNRFKQDPLKASAVAPLAYLRLSSILRAQNKAPEAVQLLQDCRAQFEAAVIADPNRAAWSPLIQYQHGLAIKETGKLADARTQFENLQQRFPASPEAAEAAWRAGQCRREEWQAKLAAANVALAKPGAKPEEIAAANAQVAEASKQLSEAAKYFVDRAGELAKKVPGSEIHQRLLYEGAWCFQSVANLEVEAARKVLAADALKKRQEQLAKSAATPAANSPVKAVPHVRPPEILNSAIPIQPSEQQARDQYKALITAKIDSPLSILARLEWAEMLARRDEHDAAIGMLNEALNLEPAQAIEERLRLRLGGCLLAKNDFANAFQQFGAVATEAKSPLMPEARYRAGECQLLLKDFAKAAEILAPFRDQQPLHNVPGISDRAMLRLGHALALAGQWEPSRQAHEILLQRFPQSLWRSEAKYGMGWALQNLKQFDPAANAYLQVIAETATEVAAKSQYQLALCRLEQKKLPEAANALLVVPFTYDYPEWSAVALLEAARVFQEMNQPEQTSRLLQRVLKDFPETEWSKTAQKKLTEMKTSEVKP